MDFLFHHGILGQKWGVRRFQNKDGSLTDAGRQRQREQIRRNRASKTRDDVESIVSNMSDKDRRLLGLHKGDEYLSIDDGKYIAKRVIARDGDIPVAFLDIYSDDKNANIVLGTRTDYQGKGYASRVTKEGMKWVDRNIGRLSHVEWNALYENEASKHLAEKYGFERAPDWDYEDDIGKYATYLKRNKGDINDR